MSLRGHVEILNRSQSLDHLYLSYLEKEFYNKQGTNRKQGGYIYKRREKEEEEVISEVEERKKESEERSRQRQSLIETTRK
jgi:hypothetical protein